MNEPAACGNIQVLATSETPILFCAENAVIPDPYVHCKYFEYLDALMRMVYEYSVA
jgi:hypothetical protein